MTTPSEMAEAMALLWAKFLPEMQQRVSLVEEAANAAAAGTLTDEQRVAGHAAAHKLAGSLGLFGTKRGTELARQIEQALEDSASTPSADLLAWTAELRLLIQSRS